MYLIFSPTFSAFNTNIYNYFLGLIVICKCTLADVCDDTNMALGMSTLMATYSIGLIVAPSLGGINPILCVATDLVVGYDMPVFLTNKYFIIGFLAFPAEQYPHSFASGTFC